MPELTNNNLKIAIFGASSQVGSSVAFYFKHFTTHEPICFIRSKYSSIFFEMSNIKTVTVDIKEINILKEELKNVDIVLDFSLPSSDAYEMWRMIKQNLQYIISATPTSAIFIYMSSIMAYGMPNNEKRLKSYRFPRAFYGFIKRKTERLVVSMGLRYKVDVYNFRLGQVHGFLQSVSESFRDKLSSVKVAYLDGDENDFTNTIFISSLCDAIIACRYQRIKPAVYTLVSYPQWTLKELYTFYLDYFFLDTHIIFKPKHTKKKITIKEYLYTYIKKYRPLLETYILLYIPKTAIALKGKYRVSEVKSLASTKNINYLDYNLVGIPSVPVIKNLNCSISDIKEREQAMEKLYLSLINQNEKNA
jgi:NAD dependent epimerase/dehydratase family.